jgi:hypothetical protein
MQKAEIRRITVLGPSEKKFVGLHLNREIWAWWSVPVIPMTMGGLK